MITGSKRALAVWSKCTCPAGPKGPCPGLCIVANTDTTLTLKDSLTDLNGSNYTVTGVSSVMGGTGTLRVLGIPGVAIFGTVTVQINSTGTAVVGDTFFPDTDTPIISFQDGVDGFVLGRRVIRVSGDLDLDIAGQILSGQVSFEQIIEKGPDGIAGNTDDVAIITIGLNDVQLVLGDTDPDDDVPAPVRVNIPTGIIRLEPTGVVAVVLGANADLDLPGVAASIQDLSILINTQLDPATVNIVTGTVDSVATSTVTDLGAAFDTVGNLAGFEFQVIAGTGAGLRASVVSQTATTLVLDQSLGLGSDSQYVVTATVTPGVRVVALGVSLELFGRV